MNFKEILEVTLTNMTMTAALQLSSMLGENDVLKSLGYHIFIEERQWDLIHYDNEDFFDYDVDTDHYWGSLFVNGYAIEYSVSLVENSSTMKGQMIFCPKLKIVDREIRNLFESKYN